MADLTPRQAYWLKRIADGDGAVASSNVTLRGLARRGLVRVVWQDRANLVTGKFARWVLTEKSKALIVAAKQQAGAS